jgi:hypothetical protein
MEIENNQVPYQTLPDKTREMNYQNPGLTRDRVPPSTKPMAKHFGSA